MNPVKTPASRPAHKIPVYEVRLVPCRKPLRLAESVVPESRSAARVLYDLISLTDREHLACLFLDGRHRITGAHIAAIGGQHAIGAVDLRVIFRAALAACASAIVLGHNHPSGDPTPSSEDMAFTERAVRAADILCLPIVDHVIVTRDQACSYSMVDRGTMPRA
jgi:DNA repair protein RadC